jgi:hypothetical protein
MMAGADGDAYDGDVLPLDPTCPYCASHFGGGEGFDGSEFNCGNCGRLIAMCAWTDGTMSMIRPTPDPFAKTRDGRRRTRRLWARRGRR